MITILLPFWKKFCFILAAKSSTKKREQMQTVSGHAISLHNLTEVEFREALAEDKHLEKLGRIIDERSIIILLSLIIIFCIIILVL